MPEGQEKIPLDARLLSDAIIELNISRRNISIYPRDHPSVEKSLNRAFEFLQKLFDLRPEITLAVARDTLIIDDYFLDKKNPVYREFALHLSRMNLASITFVTGLTKDELYEFHRFISQHIKEKPSEMFQDMFQGLNLIHIKANFIDYTAFTFEEGTTQKGTSDVQLWERYIYGLLDGTLMIGDATDHIMEIPPDTLARLLNKEITDDLKEETYDRVITSYIRRSSESAFSSSDLRRIMDFISSLRPELKKQFLTSTVRTISKDIDSSYKALGGISIDDVMALLETINEQKMVIPEALKNILSRLSNLPQEGTDSLTFSGNLIVDDMFISPDIVNLFSGNFESFISAAYQREIQKFLDFSGPKTTVPELGGLEREFNEDFVENDFNQTVLELILSDMLSEEEYQYFLNVLQEQSEQFLWTARYSQVLKTLKVLQEYAETEKFRALTANALQYYYSHEFISGIINSFRLLGKQTREEAWLICEYYGEKIIVPLMDALTEESSQTVRRFFMVLLRQFGDNAVPEAIKRLGDDRWFVKRNMLFILSECRSKEALPHIRPYCRHENRKVSFEAVKCFLHTGDIFGLKVVREYLHADSREMVEQAVSLSGSFRIREVVPDLIQLLKKRGISGADLYDKIPIVKALGDIGDPQALDALKDLLSGKSILFKAAVDKLKEEIYRTLRNYPHDAIRDFIEAGLKSKNAYIKEESLRLSKSGVR